VSCPFAGKFKIKRKIIRNPGTDNDAIIFFFIISGIRLILYKDRLKSAICEKGNISFTN
jgi:hypothetical protein